MNADPIPDLELEYHRLERQAMLFKTFSLCALIFSSVASAAAQALQPGRYTITSVFSGPSANRGNVMLRDPGSDQWAVIPDISTIGLLENRDKWDLTPGQNGGFIIQNVQFSTFLTVGPANLDVPVRSTQDRTQATSFVITNAGSGTYHIQVAGEDSLWMVPIAIVPQIPPLDSVAFTEHANGGQQQLWNVTPA